MAKRAEYEVVVSRMSKYGVAEISSKVTSMLGEGWMLYGNPMMVGYDNGIWISQGLVREQEVVEDVPENNEN